MKRVSVLAGSLAAAHSGRWLLAALLAFATLAMPHPWQPVAVADDDDGGGDDDGNGGNARSTGNDRSSRSRLLNARKPVIQRKAIQPARPVLVVLDLPEPSQAEARRRGFTVLSDERLEVIGVRVQRMRSPRRMSVASARRILAELGAAQSDVNGLYRAQDEPESCQTGKGCDPLQLINWPANVPASCGAGIVVGIVETAVDRNNSAVAGQDLETIDLRPKDTRASASEHGTAVAALIAGASDSKAPGLLPKAKLIAAVPYYRSSRGQDLAQAYDVVRAIDALLKRKPHVLNLSLAGPSNTVLERAIGRATDIGVPVVAAAGNAGSGAKPQFPAAYTEAIAVTAISSNLKIYRRAPRGDHIDFAAPGVNIDVVAGRDRTAKRSGTSFAAPFVAAALALLRQSSPHLTVETLVSELAADARDLGDPGKDRVFGWGLLQTQVRCSG